MTVKIPLSRRCIEVTSFLAMEMMEQAKALEAAGQEIIYLCLGEHIDGNSRRLSLAILKTTGVALTPGIDFGAGAEGYLRFTYANSLPNIKKALDRLEVYLRQRASE
jgi:aspartate/methionine/tyrosine aminotransferase